MTDRITLSEEQRDALMFGVDRRIYTETCADIIGEPVDLIEKIGRLDVEIRIFRALRYGSAPYELDVSSGELAKVVGETLVYLDDWLGDSASVEEVGHRAPLMSILAGVTAEVA